MKEKLTRILKLCPVKMWRALGNPRFREAVLEMFPET